MSDLKKTDKVNSSSKKRRERVVSSPSTVEKEIVLQEKVVHINRCAKVVKGGRRFGFAALVIVGNQMGRIGVGYGKAKEVPDAIKKGTEKAKKNMMSFNMKENTIPHMSIGVSDGGRVLLRPASPGTGVIAGGGVRAVLEALGVKDILTKSLGSKNPFSVVRATINALRKIRTYEQIKGIRLAGSDDNLIG
ncbi:MAG: 30S ribosomal protein S5 [Puniceicoccales bacterium]|jgi:small subunit ribosomal protein S5|nr:30S ribosomal protein S5 [Puniceicoccales bacterium]